MVVKVFYWIIFHQYKMIKKLKLHNSGIIIEKNITNPIFKNNSIFHNELTVVFKKKTWWEYVV